MVSIHESVRQLRAAEAPKKPRLAATRLLANRAAMEAPKFDVRDVAQLARLALTDDEVAQFQGQLAQVVEYVAQLDSLDVDGIEPTAHAQDVHNVTRADEVRPGLSPSEALAGAPATNGGMFLTVRVVE